MDADYVSDAPPPASIPPLPVIQTPPTDDEKPKRHRRLDKEVRYLKDWFIHLYCVDGIHNTATLSKMLGVDQRQVRRWIQDAVPEDARGKPKRRSRAEIAIIRLECHRLYTEGEHSAGALSELLGVNARQVRRWISDDFRVSSTSSMKPMELVVA